MRIPPFFSRLAAVVLLAAAPLAAAVSQAPAKHMLYKVRGPSGATVYLLGSVHLLSAEAGKLPAEVDTAYAHAKTLAFETSIDTVQLRAQELLMKARYADGKTLRASLSPADAAKADSVLRQYGLMLDQVGAFKPWFVSLLLTQMVVQKANFQPQYGVDMQLHTRAKADAKPERSLETVDFQLNLFDSIDPADQAKMLLSAKGPQESAKQLVQIKDFWLAGDAAHLDSLMNSDDDAPGARAMILTDRNARWVPQIEQMLKGKDDVLVVVGAAHLVGKQGVVELLKAKGYTVEQL